jgi:hypothetical protein
MSTLSMSSTLVGLACAGVATALTWLFTTVRYRAMLATVAARVEQAERAKQKAQELAIQSRQQVEALQQALSEAKRDGVIQTAAVSARAATEAAEAAKVAKAKARAELLRQLDSADTKDGAAQGFPDTQPLINN